MEHRYVMKAIEAHAPVEDLKGGYLHAIRRGKKVVYWVSQYAHSGDVIHTGMYTREGLAAEVSWPDPVTALRFLGFIADKSK